MKTLENEHRDSFSASPLFEQSNFETRCHPELVEGRARVQKVGDFMGLAEPCRLNVQSLFVV